MNVCILEVCEESARIAKRRERNERKKKGKTNTTKKLIFSLNKIK